MFFPEKSNLFKLKYEYRLDSLPLFRVIGKYNPVKSGLGFQYSLIKESSGFAYLCVNRYRLENGPLNQCSFNFNLSTQWGSEGCYANVCKQNTKMWDYEARDAYFQAVLSVGVPITVYQPESDRRARFTPDLGRNINDVHYLLIVEVFL